MIKNTNEKDIHQLLSNITNERYKRMLASGVSTLLKPPKASDAQVQCGQLEDEALCYLMLAVYPVMLHVICLFTIIMQMAPGAACLFVFFGRS